MHVSSLNCFSPFFFTFRKCDSLLPFLRFSLHENLCCDLHNDWLFFSATEEQEGHRLEEKTKNNAKYQLHISVSCMSLRNPERKFESRLDGPCSPGLVVLHSRLLHCAGLPHILCGLQTTGSVVRQVTRPSGTREVHGAPLCPHDPGVVLCCPLPLKLCLMVVPVCVQPFLLPLHVFHQCLQLAADSDRHRRFDPRYLGLLSNVVAVVCRNQREAVLLTVGYHLDAS
mmetsp:Transcript_34397/g.68004  ORF Transcript_34397/g.68004 Transcript_34397/m.68004 type:complete len:227 (+) Transcript_34397:158-838(+)